MTATAVETTRSDRFRQMAAKLADEINYKRNSGVSAQRMTRRRAGMAESARREAERMERVQLALVGIAAALDDGTLPASLAKVSTKGQIQTLLTWPRWNSDVYAQHERDQLYRAGVAESTFAAARDGLLGLMPGADPGHCRKARIAAMERALIGTKFPGFFPTPPALVEHLLDLADADAGHRILEPSAGKGDIADGIRTLTPSASLYVCEIQPKLSEILAAKGFTSIGSDFLEISPEGHHAYDRIVMNPPFERGQDITHVQHAFRFLSPGGRLVSVVSAGTYTNRNTKAEEFRHWVCGVRGEWHTVTPGAFAAGDRNTGISTGVATRLLVIDKTA
jgi:predicted RNA methylase